MAQDVLAAAVGRWLLALGAVLAPLGVGAQEPARAGVAGVVAGILSYTRWPAEPSPIKLCTLGRGGAVDELNRSLDLGSAQRQVVVQALRGSTPRRGDCDALFVGATDAAGTRVVLRELAGQPVLVLGQGSEFCSDGGMFCLEDAGGSKVRFQANLDAIARSGLRVHPQVLRIARSTPGGAP